MQRRLECRLQGIDSRSATSVRLLPPIKCAPAKKLKSDFNLKQFEEVAFICSRHVCRLMLGMEDFSTCLCLGEGLQRKIAD